MNPDDGKKPSSPPPEPPPIQVVDENAQPTIGLEKAIVQETVEKRAEKD